MKRLAFLTMLLLSFSYLCDAQQRSIAKDSENRSLALSKPSSMEDRAAGTHNGSNIGLFFENRGKLYPRRLRDGPSGEWPLNSGRHYVYRINPMVGVPKNVIQGRYTDDEEWEAVGGYHNPIAPKVAFSDNPATWHPTLGWPVKDAVGKNVIKSDQDSYCVYEDANNRYGALGVRIIQTGYAYGVALAQNILFFKFQVTNRGSRDLDSLYFGLYCDIDMGNVSGGAPEYGDDKIGYDKAKNFLYFYDAKGYSKEWPDPRTGYFGCTFLKTPTVNSVERGITDMHYNLYDDDLDYDTLQYGMMASTPSLYSSPLGSKYFHIGSSTDLHYDDPATVPNAGLDLVGIMSSGPYLLKRGDTLTFHTAIIAAYELSALMATYDQAKKIVTLDYTFEIRPPATPKLTGLAGDGQATLFWDDAAELSFDKFSGQYDFEGYRLYRSVDKGVTWTRLADYDKINSIGKETGLQYNYADTTVVNGIEYWYTVTSYDRGDSLVPSLESALGKTTISQNLAAIVPRSTSLGWNAVHADSNLYTSKGKSNYTLRVQPTDLPSLGNGSYKIGFTYIQRTDRGTLRTKATALVGDSQKVIPCSYAFKFTGSKSLDIYNLTADTVYQTERNYNPAAGSTYTVQTGGIPPTLRVRLEDPNKSAPPDSLPKAGDIVSMNFAVYCIKDNGDTVIAPRPFSIEHSQATYDGVIFSLNPPDIIQNVSRIGGTDNISMSFSVAYPESVINKQYLVSTTGRGFHPVSGKGFISLLIRGAALDTVLRFDTVYTPATVEFHGVSARIEFSSNNPPGAGNTFSLQTVVPIRPSLKDSYSFTVVGSSVDQARAKHELGNIKVVPNPYVVSSLYEPEFAELRLEPLRKLQFTNLPNRCTIHIFTLDGNLIKTIVHDSHGGTAEWNLRADGGREIVSGIYLFVVKSDVGEHLGRFAVIK